ncbi:phosphoribosylformylglycinamidine synthase I [Candidatus Peregrinibacteria bacterium]|nr:phosphoribosylformylglycinamidine synthase I [Candidatus Peregrinibacteria bacterium]
MPSTIAVISFPGTNCEIESLRAIRRAGMEAVNLRWNAAPRSDALASTIGGYFLPGGFSYEDRGRSGMIAAHDPLLDFLREESQRGKVIIGHCNGAQILVESGLIPLDKGLRMALAKNKISNAECRISNFLNKWVWIIPTCSKNRCAVSEWRGTMHVPIAHGEGRFTTRDKDLIKELEENDQIAFRYCDENGAISEESNPNGSIESIAGICNPMGNVIALMPHPERTINGDPYFCSLNTWLTRK